MVDLIYKMTNLVWIDLEFTGLDYKTEKILEIAVIITDSRLNVLGTPLEFVIHQEKHILDAMDEWCIETHGNSGLIDKCLKSTNTIENTTPKIMKYITTYCERNDCHLAGNSIWMDKFIIYIYYPEITNFLHFQLVDVTSIAKIVKMFNIGNKYKKNYNHRALSDIEESISELKYYIDLMN